MSSRALALGTAAALLAACAAPRPVTGQVEHIVFMWLAQPGDRAAEELLARTGRGFVGRIPGLRAVAVGDALPGNGAFHDRSFDLAFVMRFADARALAAYQDHPLHAEAVRKALAPHVKRLLVYDLVLR